MLEIKRLSQLGSVLYIAAHPDDENTNVLAYLSKNRLLRTGYLAMTRGDGGQNLVGSEKGDLIGVMRTQELLEARRIDGGEQYFTRAIDFGYTKDKDETFNFWQKEKILSDVVWVIRQFRPDVIITRFPGDGRGGHGQHTASALLAQEAFKAAADPNRFSEQLKILETWQAKRIFWDMFNFGNSAPDYDPKKTIVTDIGQYQPLTGLSSTELAALSRSMHKSQGFGARGFRGSRQAYFELTDGATAKTDILDGVTTNWSRVKGSKQIASLITQIEKKYNPQNPSQSVPDLLKLYKLLNGKQYWIRKKQEEVKQLILECSGLWLEAITEDFSATADSKLAVDFEVVNRSTNQIKLKSIALPFNSYKKEYDTALKNNTPLTEQIELKLNADLPLSEPYWLKSEHEFGIFTMNDKEKTGLAEFNPYQAEFVLSFSGTEISYQSEVKYRWTDRVKGELYRPFELR
ncbi:MAG: PIG-L family deacetylase, partial [Calditrichaeota bacterium]|nr:PIG-L family deacetylase [Calditrichota bacterium]